MNIITHHQRRSFLIYKDDLDAVQDFSDEELGQLLRLIFEYQKNPENPVGSLGSLGFPKVLTAFNFFKKQFERDNEKYNLVVKRNQINGLKGGRPKNSSKNIKNPKNPENPVGPDADADIYINNIWEHYIVTKKTREILTIGRRTKLAKRLEKFTPEQIKQAVTNMCGDRFWVKMNCDYLFKNDENMDRILNLTTPEKTVTGANAAMLAKQL